MLNTDFWGTNSKISDLKKAIKSSFLKIKEELNQHLDTINDNTKEIQTNYDSTTRIEAKIDKLNERIEDIEMLFRKINKESVSSFKIKTLTKREQEIFLALYTLEQDTEPVTYLRIAHFLALSPYIVEGYISNLIGKGVPVIKSYSGNMTFIRFDPIFREIQAKRNLAKISESIYQKINSI